MMEIFLFAVSGIHVIYYAVLVLFTDFTWMTQLYWPVSAVIFVLIAQLLRIDRMRKQKHRRCMPMVLRTVICTSCGLYFLLIGVFTVLIFSQGFYENPEDADYLIFIENGDVETTLTESDYNALACTIDYMTRHEDTSVVLAGCSRFRDLEVNENEIQDLMKKYLIDQGIGEDRIITEEISNNLRQNIMYSYAYILMDWYGDDADREAEPAVGIVAEAASVFRYRMIVRNLGDVSRHMKIISFHEPVLVWPARIVEEVQLIVKFHLINQFEYTPSSTPDL
ncbi:MAG: ElyC/SanA/YdcF family protein [Lachnospiraceae bacterium]